MVFTVKYDITVILFIAFSIHNRYIFFELTKVFIALLLLCICIIISNHIILFELFHGLIMIHCFNISHLFVIICIIMMLLLFPITLTISFDLLAVSIANSETRLFEYLLKCFILQFGVMGLS